MTQRERALKRAVCMMTHDQRRVVIDGLRTLLQSILDSKEAQGNLSTQEEDRRLYATVLGLLLPIVNT